MDVQGDSRIQKENIVEQLNLLSLHWKEMMREMETARVTFFGELRVLLKQEMKKEAQSRSQDVVENVKITNVEGDKRGHVLETLQTPKKLVADSQYMIYKRDELSCGHKESLTEIGVIVEGRKPIDGMQQWQTPYQLSNGYNGSGTEMGMGGRFEGRKPNNGMSVSVQQWQIFDGGGLDI